MTDEELVVSFSSRAWGFEIPSEEKDYKNFVSGLRAIYARAQWNIAHEHINRKIEKDKISNLKDYKPYTKIQILLLKFKKYVRATKI